MAETKTFDDITAARPALAKDYLAQLAGQPGRPLALFAPRRIGKTFFLQQDLVPAAITAKMLTVYVDLWLQRNDPLSAVNHALEETLNDLTAPKGRVGKIAKTTVKKIGALGASIDFGDEPVEKPLPTAPALRFDALVVRIAALAKKRILLMLDEAQTLGELNDGDALVGAIRAVLQKRKSIVDAVLTGSSQSGLANLMSAAGAPMYQFTQMVNFPYLDDAFLKPLREHYARVHRGKAPAIADLRRLFERIGYRPALMKDLVKQMSAEGITDIDLAVKHFMQDARQTSGWVALLDSLALLDRAVLIAIADKKELLAKDTLDWLARTSASEATISKVRTAIERLRKRGLIRKEADVPATLEDPLFAEYLVSLKGK
jgi:uncharacterized protein